MSKSMKTTLNELCQKDIATASDAELYTALLKLVQEQSQKQIKPVTGRKLYYISAEFLMKKSTVITKTDTITRKIQSCKTVKEEPIC